MRFRVTLIAEVQRIFGCDSGTFGLFGSKAKSEVCTVSWCGEVTEGDGEDL